MVTDLMKDVSPLDLTESLVSINSTDPGQFELEIFTYLKNLINKYIDISGAQEYASVDSIEVLPGRNCLKAEIQGTDQSAPALVYICHMDTVTDGDGWNAETPAFSPVVKDGKLYGRGSCDMKGGLACATLSFRDTLSRVLETGVKPHRTFKLICTCDEEADMRGAEAVINAGWVDANDWVLDTEPTDGRIRVAHKGRTWFRLAFEGVTAHASTPEQGADAICALAYAITDLKERVMALPDHEDLGRTTVTFGMCSGGYQPYVVPDNAWTTIDMRLVPPTTPADAEKLVELAIEHAELNVPGAKGSYMVTGNRPAIECHPGQGLLEALKDAVAKTVDESPVVDIFTGYTDTAVIAGTLGNVTTASYGPGNLFMAHKPNEYVCIEDLERVHKVLNRLAADTIF